MEEYQPPSRVRGMGLRPGPFPIRLSWRRVSEKGIQISDNAKIQGPEKSDSYVSIVYGVDLLRIFIEIGIAAKMSRVIFCPRRDSRAGPGKSAQRTKSATFSGWPILIIFIQ